MRGCGLNGFNHVKIGSYGGSPSAALFGVTYFRRATAPGPRRKRNANQSRESDSRKITGNYRWRADADCNFPQVQNGMRDEPRRCSSPQLKATRRSDHTDAESCAEEHLNKPDIADEVLIKGTSVGHAWDGVIPRRWNDEHE